MSLGALLARENFQLRAEHESLRATVAKQAARLTHLLSAANEVLNCADQDVGRFGIEVPADIAWKFAHAVRHAEGTMDLLENCAQCNPSLTPPSGADGGT